MKAVAFLYWIVIFNSIMSILMVFLNSGWWLPAGAEAVISLPYSTDLAVAVENFSNSVSALFAGDIGALFTAFISLFVMLFQFLGSLVGFLPSLLAFFGVPDPICSLIRVLMLIALFICIVQLVSNRSMLYNE